MAIFCLCMKSLSGFARDTFYRLLFFHNHHFLEGKCHFLEPALTQVRLPGLSKLIAYLGVNSILCHHHCHERMDSVKLVPTHFLWFYESAEAHVSRTLRQ